MRTRISMLSFILAFVACASPSPLNNIPLDLPQGDMKPHDVPVPGVDMQKSETRDIGDSGDARDAQKTDTITDTNGGDTQQARAYPVRKCTITLKFQAPQGAKTVTVPAEWNKWDKTATPMQKGAAGEFTVEFKGNDAIPPGEWGYKFLVDGKDWVMDPENPLSKWVDGIQNSKLVMPNCNLPLIELDKVTTDAKNMHIHIEFSVFRGQDKRPVNHVSVEQAGKAVKFSVGDDGHGIIDFDAPAKDKYGFLITASSDTGKAQRYVPVWLEDKAFSWRDAVIYFPMTDRFMDGDKANDKPAECLDAHNKANWLGGDFAGIKQKIDAGYFDKLGINTLWLGPVWNNPNGCYPGAVNHTYTAYHGYFPLDYSTIEEHYGTLDELKALIDDAHKHGIRVLADLPANHVFQDSKIFSMHRDWFHYGKVGQTPLICSDDDNWNKHPIDCWFQPYLPDFDYTNNEAVDFVTNAAVRFIQETGVDGFRVDAVKHMVPNFIKTLRYKIRKQIETPDLHFYMVGETFVGEWGGGTGQSETLIKKYVSSDQLDGQFDFPLYWAVLKAFARHTESFSDLAGMLAQDEGYYGKAAIMSTFIGNQDVPRFISHASGVIADQWGNGARQQGWDNPPALPTDKTPYNRLKSAFAFVMCIPGVPLVYYGDEVAMPGAGDPDNRRMMQFDGLTDLQKDVKDTLSKAIAFRKDHPATRRATPVVLSKGTDYLAIGDDQGGDAVVCLFTRESVRDMVVPLGKLPDMKGVHGLKDRLTGAVYPVTDGKISVHFDKNRCAMLEAQ